MKIFGILLKYVFLAGIIVSCVEKANLDPRERLVYVDAILENSDVQRIKLKYTSYVSESKYLPVEKADVIVEEYIDGEKSKCFTFERKVSGDWESVFRPIPKARYKLTVDIPGFPVMISETEYPDTLVFVNYNVDTMNHIMLPDLVDYSYKSDSCYLWLYYADYLPEEKHWEISDSMTVAYSRSIGTESDHWDESFYIPHVGVYIDTAWRTIPELNYYDRYKRYHGPGSYGVARGIPFTAQYDGLTLDLHGFKALYSRKVVADGLVYRSSNPKWKQDGLLHPDSYIVLQSIDEGYDRYLRELYAFDLGFNRIKDSDLAFLWDYKEVYSNIKNGLGIFGCTAKCKLYLKDCKGINEIPIWERFEIILPD